jgi:hypothetical protein
VALSLFQHGGSALVPLAPDAVIEADALLAMSYATTAARIPHRVIVVAIDATKEVHWLYPSFVDPARIPEPVVLEPGRADTPMATIVRLEAPAAGPLTVIALLDPTDPAIVQHVEASRLTERTADGLRALIGAADARSWNLHVTYEGGAR